MQGLANSAPTDSHGGTIAGVRQVAPPSATSTASTFPPVHAGATQYQPYTEAPLQALGIAPSTFVSTQPEMHSPMPFRPTASSTVVPSPQQLHVQQQQMQQQQYGQLHQQQVQQSQQLPAPQIQQAQQRPMGLPATVHMNGHIQARPPQQARPPYTGQPGGYTQLRPGTGVSRPPSGAAAAAAQQQIRPHALAPVTPRRVSPMPFKLIAPNSAVRTIPATVQARLSMGSVAPRVPVPAPGATPRPQVVMGVPAGGRGALQMAAPVTGVPHPSAGAPGAAAPGRPIMRPASQPHVNVNTAADM